MSKILVTGGAGFIGSHLVRALCEKGEDIVIVDDFNDYYDPQLKEARVSYFLKGLDFMIYRIDIRDFDGLNKIFKKEKPDKICHLAARAGVRASILNPLLCTDVNIMGTLNLLELAKKHSISKFIFASSSSIYGGSKKLPFSESDDVSNPISPYATTKRSGELIVYTYSHLYQIQSVCLRYFTVYGPWGRPDMALFLFADSILRGKPIKVFNYGKMRRDFTYIDDIVSGTLKAIDNYMSYEIINLGNHSPTDLEYLISLIESEFGRKAIKKYMPLQIGDMPETYADITKAKKLLNFEPKVSIEEGVKKFTIWWREYNSKFKVQKSK